MDVAAPYRCVARVTPSSLQVLAFKKEHGEELSAASRAVDNAVEKIKNNMVWMEHNYKTIVSWLQKAGYNYKLRSSFFD